MKKKYSLLANITTPQSASFARKRRIKGKSKQRSSEIDKMSKSLVEPGIMDYVCSHPRQTGRSLVTPVNAEQTYNFILKKKFTPKKPPRLNIMFGNYPIPKNLMVTGDVKIMEARKKQPLQAQQMSMPVFKKRGSFNATLSYDASKANDLDITSNTPKSSTTKKIPYSRSRTSTLMTTDTEADRPKAKGSEPKIRARQRVNSSKLNMFETEKRKEIAKEEAIKFKEILPRELGDIIRRSNGMISEQPDRGCIYKYYIELGNNGSLVKQLLTARSGWVSVDNADHANFIWTQWGDYDIFETMEYGKKDAEAIEAPAPSAKDLKQRQLKAQIPKKRIEQEFSAQGLT